MSRAPRREGDQGGRASSPDKRSVAQSSKASNHSGRNVRGGSRVDQARSVAFEVLVAVDSDDAYANLLLPSLISKSRLEPRDAAFATELTYSTLRLRGQIDAILESAAQRTIGSIDVSSRNALRLGACQLLNMRTAEHAAVSTSVELARQARESSAGFVNAVLRKVQTRTLPEWISALTHSANDDNAVALRWSHPRWMVAALRDALLDGGRGRDELELLLAANNRAAKPMLIARPEVCDLSELMIDEQQSRGQWSPFAVTAPAGDPGQLAAVREGRAAVQDEGSQLVALLAAAVPVTGRDAVWLDGCAGPGGKAGLLAALAGPREANVHAVDVSAHRSELVAATCRPFPNVSVHLGDVVAVAAQQWFPEGGFDRILVDVPCTGMGALRRRPELRWRRTPGDIGKLARIQESILRSALNMARVGGVVVYSTCSPHVLEASAVVERVVSSLAPEGINAHVVDVRDVIAQAHIAVQAEALIATQHDRYLRLWPHVHGTDAMFAAVVVRDA